MTRPLTVKISRNGVEIGSYEASEAVRLLVYGTLRDADFYWHEGMTEWAPLHELRDSEARRQLAEKELQRKQDEARRAEQLAKEKAERDEQMAREKAKAQEEEDRAVAEAVRLRLEKEKANYFKCGCCRESFKAPKDPASDFGPAIAGLIFSGILAFIPVVGWVVGPILAIYCFCIILASQIVAPYCPSCRSANFSRPENAGDQK